MLIKYIITFYSIVIIFLLTHLEICIKIIDQPSNRGFIVVKSREKVLETHGKVGLTNLILTTVSVAAICIGWVWRDNIKGNRA